MYGRISQGVEGVGISLDELVIGCRFKCQGEGIDVNIILGSLEAVDIDSHVVEVFPYHIVLTSPSKNDAIAIAARE